MKRLLLSACIVTLANPLLAGSPEITNVRATEHPDGCGSASLFVTKTLAGTTTLMAGPSCWKITAKLDFDCLRIRMWMNSLSRAH